MAGSVLMLLAILGLAYLHSTSGGGYSFELVKLSQLAADTPKTVKWRLRAKAGDRVRWYELPEEVAH
jgi:hypothetical protein